MGKKAVTTVKPIRKGERTRQQILAVATDIASAEGLEGLTIGALAKLLDISKSGLFAHFGSKEELQLAVVDLARKRFETVVLPRAEGAQDGLPKLHALLLSWADSIDKSDYRGGCFFAAVSSEFDDRPGPVRDEIALLSRAWIDLLIAEIKNARSRKHLLSKVDAVQMAFELHAFVQEANWAKQLLGDKRAFQRAKRSIYACLEREATATGKRLMSSA